MGAGKYIQLHSMHGLIRGESTELGRDADTGGQVVYVLALARALARHPDVDRVELVTRLIRDPAVSEDYAVPLEPIGNNAWIVRVPCGPEGYVRKEELWPCIDDYVEGVLAHVRDLGRVPDLLHSHYADAGAACTALSRELGVPQAHTGHSLGRAKQRQTLASGADADEVERQFHFSRRIAEEEATFRHAAFIVAGTHQERREQYGLYEADTAAKIEVIPPGIDVSKFFAYFEGRSPEVIRKMNAEFARFLRNNDKPPILTISRPDRKKNLSALVQAYGEDPDLQELANLVIFAGVRSDIAAMPANEREVLTDLLIQMDKYDLYGKMALPKTHEFETDVPSLYRMAARKGGIFVNTSLNESFGLTLLEAAASGLPIVATNDGGPPDIVGACRNGIVIPPTDTRAIARAMRTILEDPELWHRMSESGVGGVRANYSWEAHVDVYMALVDQVLGGEPLVSVKDRPSLRKLVVCDVDDVLTGDPESTRRIGAWLEAHRGEVRWALTTGRTLTSLRGLIRRRIVPEPDYIVASAGTEICLLPDFHPVIEWKARARSGWNRGRIRQILDGFPALLPQEATAQSRLKISYYVDSGDPLGLVRTVSEQLREAGFRCKVVFSNDDVLDVVPDEASKAQAVCWLMDALGIPPQDVLICGDSGDDAEMLQLSTFAVVPASHKPDIEHLAGKGGVYFAASPFADAIVEAVAHYGFLAPARPGR